MSNLSDGGRESAVDSRSVLYAAVTRGMRAQRIPLLNALRLLLREYYCFTERGDDCSHALSRRTMAWLCPSFADLHCMVHRFLEAISGWLAKVDR